MDLNLIADFIRTRIRVGRQQPRDTRAEYAEAETRAAKARMLLSSDIYVEAYQDELAVIVDRLLQLDMTKPADREEALALLGLAQQQAAIARRLAGYINGFDLLKQRATKTRAA